ncbi:hypothetical protein ACERIT_05050 [Halopenitus sp. H-Gu1]|uniref:hypothetical protein n=1 Tax=Halopenitus sp. H-Gu1 TaxID=3242697 RepID=UPI00359D1182
MSVPESALKDAFEFALPDDREDMTEEEMAEHLLEHEETIKQHLRERGFEVSKSAGDSPTDLLKSLYNDNGTTSYVDSETAEMIERAFRQPDVEADETAPSLATFYGEEVDTAASSNRGDSYHESG